MLKPELRPTVIACLAGRDVQEVLYTGFVQTLSGGLRRFLSSIYNADIYRIIIRRRILEAGHPTFP